ncbi:MAG TPA: flagellar hook-associated protein FlgL, partial [Burkholderiales bacterium]|nr:flagellar hook-associated protein FlgL [Burkholderiales bacterium]
FYNAGVYGMEQQQTALFITQQQLSTGLRVYNPSVDPVAAAQALEVGQSNSINTQYQTNQNSALSSLNVNETNLASVTTLIQNVQVQAVNAGNASLTATDRQAIASQLTSLQQQLLSLANSTDSSGNYLFAGSMGGTKPFVETANGVQYLGDQGVQSVQITSARQIPVTISGAAAFQNIKTGNGSFTTSSASTNSGTGVVDNGTLTDPSKWASSANSQNLSIKFSVSGTAPNTTTTYDLVDNATGKSLFTGAASASSGPYPASFTSGGAISLSMTSAQAASIAASGADAGSNAASADSAAIAAAAPGGAAYTAAYNAAVAAGASSADAALAATNVQSAAAQAASASGATAGSIVNAEIASATISGATTGTVTSSIAASAADAAATAIANAAAQAAGTPQTASPFDFGASVTVTGSPANGDSFGINQSANESIFTTIGNLISALNSTSTGSAANAALSSKLNEIG